MSCNLKIWKLIRVSLFGGTAIGSVIFLTLNSLNQQSRTAPILDMSVEQPDKQQLLENTYLGHVEKQPDPEEPLLVLQKYMTRDSHQYLEKNRNQEQELDREIGEWEALVRDYPQSRHALARLAELYKSKADFTLDDQWKRKAADFYIQASEIGLSHGRIRYTREISELLVDLNDKTGLDGVFGSILA